MAKKKPSGHRQSCGSRHSHNARKKDIKRQRAYVQEHGAVPAPTLEEETERNARAIGDDIIRNRPRRARLWFPR